MKYLIVLLLALATSSCAIKHHGCYNAVVCILDGNVTLGDHRGWTICGIDVDVKHRTIMPNGEDCTDFKKEAGEKQP